MASISALPGIDPVSKSDAMQQRLIISLKQKAQIYIYQFFSMTKKDMFVNNESQFSCDWNTFSSRRIPDDSKIRMKKKHFDCLFFSLQKCSKFLASVLWNCSIPVTSIYILTARVC